MMHLFSWKWENGAIIQRNFEKWWSQLIWNICWKWRKNMPSFHHTFWWYSRAKTFEILMLFKTPFSNILNHKWEWVVRFLNGFVFYVALRNWRWNSFFHNFLHWRSNLIFSKTWTNFKTITFKNFIHAKKQFFLEPRRPNLLVWSQQFCFVAWQPLVWPQQLLE